MNEKASLMIIHSLSSSTSGQT